LAAEALFYAAREAIRNVARHARPPDAAGELHLRVAMTWNNGLEICIEDNGVGMGINDARRETTGSGQGMLLHATLLALAGGELHIEEMPEAGARVRLWLPPQSKD
jgi:signal transduction histidine kinase